MADRFDSLSRAMARGMSRRQAVKGLAAVMGGGVVAAMLPATAGAVNCPGGLDYVRCGQGRAATCCPPNTTCCAGKQVSRCCQPGQRCVGAGNCVPASA
jgi:hypothetical protein